MPYGAPFSVILCRLTQVPRKSWPTGHRSAEPVGGLRARQNPWLRKPQLRSLGRNSRRRPRHRRDRRISEPVPYGTPFSAILCRLTQVPRKSWPTGHRSAEPTGDMLAVPDGRCREQTMSPTLHALSPHGILWAEHRSGLDSRPHFAPLLRKGLCDMRKQSTF